MQDYMPRALTSEDIASGNLFNTPTIEEVITRRTHTLEVTAPLPSDDHERWQGMVDDGMPAGIAYNIIADGIERRKETDTYRLTTIEGEENLPPHMQATFGSTYGNVRKWRTRPKVA